MTNEASTTPLTVEQLDSIFDGTANIETVNTLLGSIGVNFQLDCTNTISSLEDVSNKDLWKIITLLLFRQHTHQYSGGSHEM